MSSNPFGESGGAVPPTPLDDRRARVAAATASPGSLAADALSPSPTTPRPSLSLTVLRNPLSAALEASPPTPPLPAAPAAAPPGKGAPVWASAPPPHPHYPPASQRQALPPSWAEAALGGALWEGVLQWCVISVGAYMGAYVRVGFQYYRTGSAPSNFAVMYAQVLGCFIMGLISEHQKAFMGGHRLGRLWYIFVATGLCGSITTFSTWQFEGNKQLLMQFDDTSGSAYHAGRFFEWVMSLWVGVILPIAALNGGQHIMQWRAGRLAAAAATTTSPTASFSSPPSPPPPASTPPQSSPRPPSTEPAPWHAAAELGILAGYVLSTLLVIVMPVLTGWYILCYTALLGSAGAFLRFKLAAWNGAPPACCGKGRACGRVGAAFGVPAGFPLGTFVANTAGTVILAASMSWSKFVLSYWAMQTQSLLYGLTTGFCGCLTTMSTFVLELHRLPRKAGYIYALTSIIAAQTAWILLFDAPAAVIANAVATSPVLTAPSVNLCVDYAGLCNQLLDELGCGQSQRFVTACGPSGGFSDWVGECRCGPAGSSGGGLDASLRVAELLIDGQVKASVLQSMVAVWPVPADGGGGLDPTVTIDFCLSFENLCATTLSRFQCPDELITLNACDRSGLRRWVGRCTCGKWIAPSRRVTQLIVDALLNWRYDMLPFGGFVTVRGNPDARTNVNPPSIDFCGALRTECTALMDHIMCPPEERSIAYCAPPGGDIATYVGVCTCFGVFTAGSSRVTELLSDGLMTPWLEDLVVPVVNASSVRDAVAGLNSSLPLFDACDSYAKLCNWILATVNCSTPVSVTVEQVCDATAPLSLVGPPVGTASPASFRGGCVCGNMTDLEDRMREYVIDTLLQTTVVTRHTFLPPPTSVYSQVAGTNPQRPWLSPLYPLPGGVGIGNCLG